MSNWGTDVRSMYSTLLYGMHAFSNDIPHTSQLVAGAEGVAACSVVR